MKDRVPAPKRNFVEIGGRVHLALDSEHVLCHDATFDAHLSEGDSSMEWHVTKSRIVTCSECITIVQLCRGVHCGAPQERVWSDD